jgi:hypothetical protein
MRRTLVVSMALVMGVGVSASGVAFASSTTTTTVGGTPSSTSTTSTTTTTPATTTTTKPVSKVYVAPLTGLPDPQHLTRFRSALTIKIDNTPEAMPQYGIQDADVIYEEIVEGGITRLAAIFNSRTPTMVGPVRSVRRTDREIVFPIGGIFAFSGGAEYALQSIETAPVKLYDESTAGAAMFRDAQRDPPHNLFANAELLMKKDGVPRPPPALFTYRSAGESAKGPLIKSFVVGFESGYAVTYDWNATTRSWDRSLFGAPDVTANGVRLSPKNVIVMDVNYVGGVGVIGSYAQLVGSGSVEIFTDGRLERGTWRRKDLAHRTVFLNAAGKAIGLTPGQTWVELLDDAESVSATAAS